MTDAAKSSFVYVTYIRTTPEKLWAALTTPEFMKKYWFGMNFETDWKVGSAWRLVFPDGRVADTSEIIEIQKLERLGRSAQATTACRSDGVSFSARRRPPAAPGTWRATRALPHRNAGCPRA